jgi:tripartite-type tricarboxylate transporter receptor subunit TctC
MKRRDLVAKAVLLTPAVFVRTARAQDNWPSRPVTIVVPFTPGGSSDIVARTMAQNMQQALGRPIVVENRPGAGGEIGARVVARTAPDGYTLMHAPISTWAINVPLRPNLGSCKPSGRRTCWW